MPPSLCGSLTSSRAQETEIHRDRNFTRARRKGLIGYSKSKEGMNMSRWEGFLKQVTREDLYQMRVDRDGHLAGSVG